MSVKIQLFEFGAYRLDFVCGVYEEKVNTRDESVARTMNSAAVTKQERQDDLRRATTTIYITNKCNQYVIFLSFITFVRLFMRNIQTAVSSHPLKTGHMFI